MSNVLSQSIPVDSTFTADGVIYPFNSGDTIYGLSITGNVTLNSDTSLVRIIVHSNKGEFMVFESYPLIALDTSYSFSDHCDETCFLDGVMPYFIRFEIINSSVFINELNLTESYVENAAEKQYQEKRSMDHSKIEIMKIIA